MSILDVRILSLKFEVSIFEFACGLGAFSANQLRSFSKGLFSTRNDFHFSLYMDRSPK